MSTPQKILADVVITGSLQVTEGITGSFKGDGSQIINIPSSSVDLSAYATLVGVSASFIDNSELTSAIENFSTRTEVSGAITGSLTPYATLLGVSSSFSTPSQVSGAITGALIPYALSSDVSASFIDNSELTSAIANFPTRLEVSGAVTGALVPYALSADVSASFVDNSELTSSIQNFPTRLEVSGAITGALVPYAQSADISSSFAGLTANNTFTGTNIFNNTITGTSAYFSGDVRINGTASITHINTIEQSSLAIGDKYIVILSGSLGHEDLDGAGILWGSGGIGPTLGNIGEHAHVLFSNQYDRLELFPGLSSSFINSSFIGDGSQLINIPASAVNLSAYATLSGVSGTFTTPTQISGAITGALVPYASLTGVSASFTTPAEVTGAFSVVTATNALTASSMSASSGIYTINALANNQFLKVTGSTITGSLNNLNYFVESENTVAPNNTRPVNALTVTGSAADIDFAIIPKGQGSIIATIPNTIGNNTINRKRGIFSVDLQLTSAINNAGALGPYGTMAGGYSNRISENASEGTIIGGSFNFIANTQGVALGNSNYVQGNAGTILGGLEASVNTYGKSAYASGRISNVADAQIGTLILKATTSASVTPRTMTSDNSVTPTTSNVFNITAQNYSAAQVKTELIARDTSGSMKYWTFDCMFMIGTASTDVNIVGPIMTSEFSSSNLASSWNADIYANTTRGSLEVTVTGSATQSIRWVAKMSSIELYHPTGLS